MLLREFFLKLGLEVDEAAFAKGQLAAGLVEAALHKVVDVASELAHAFVENTLEAVEYGDRIKKTSQSIGIATAALQELQYAGRLADLGAEGMSQSIGILSRKMQEAKSGSEETAKAFKGIGFQEHGKLKATEEVLGEIAERFKKMPDGPEKTAQAMQLFGRAGKQMIPLLNQGREHLEEMRQEARDLGLVMGGEVINASEELNDNFKRLKAVTEGLWRGAVSPLIPEINKLVERFLAWKKANAAIISQKLRNVMHDVLVVIEKLGDAFSFVAKNALAFKIILGVAGIYGAINLLAPKLEMLRALGVKAARELMWSWIKAAAPFLLIAGIVTGFLLIFDDLRRYAQGKKSAFGYFEASIRKWLQIDPTDSPFMRGIKLFIGSLVEATGYLADLDDFFGDGKRARALAERRAGKSKKQVDAEADAQTMKVARQRVGQGLPLSADEKAALGRAGVPEEAFVKQYSKGGPGYTAPTAPAPEIYSPSDSGQLQPGGGVTLNNQSTFNITQQPWEDSEALAQRVGQVVDERLQTHVEAAGAGVRK